MGKNLISVILPTYNVEEYIGKCLDSLINQTYKNLEILVVDDGSTDNSGKIADQYALNDNRIRVIHKLNGGVSDARNVGIENATGDFIGFVDPDDFVSLDFYEFLMKLQKENDADIVQCDYVRVYKENVDTFEFPIKKEEFKIVTDKYGAFYMYLSDDDDTSTHFAVLWNKLYRKEIFENIKFPTGKTHEDQFTVYKLLDKCNKFVFSNNVKYGYYQRKNSIMTKKLTTKRFEVFEAFDNFIEYLQKNEYEEFEGYLLRRYLRMVIEIADLLDTADFEDRESLKNDLINFWNSRYDYTLNFMKNSDIHISQVNRILSLKEEFENIVNKF